MTCPTYSVGSMPSPSARMARSAAAAPRRYDPACGWAFAISSALISSAPAQRSIVARSQEKRQPLYAIALALFPVARAARLALLQRLVHVLEEVDHGRRCV